MPNSRQWAVLFWLAAILAFALSKSDVRLKLREALGTAASPKLAIPLLLMLAWVLLEVWLGALTSNWDVRLSTDTAFWFVFSGLALFGNFQDASRDPTFLRKKVLGAFAPVVIMEAFLDEFVYPWPAEIILQLVLAVLVGMAAVAPSMGHRYRTTGTLVSAAASLIVVAMIVAAFLEAFIRWDDIDKASLFRQIALPVWLTIGLLPFIYLIALYAAYELLFMRLDHFASGARRRWPLKLALLISLHMKAAEVASFAGVWPQRLAAASSFSEAGAVIRDFRQSRAQEGRAQAEAKARLARYSGVDGVDEGGRRLDRREFAETTDALRWLAACMMGWYRHENRYQDLLERFGDDTFRNALPQPSGIAIRLHANAPSWYAWRRTVTGWSFAIGAAGPPPDQWEYDGPEPPNGFPGEDPAWGSHAFSDEANHNW